MTGFTLTRTRRKTIALYIRNGGVEIRAPLRASMRDIDNFVASKEKWITDKLMQSNERAIRRENFNLNYGDSVTYRGNEYPIAARAGKLVGFDERFYMPPDLSPEQIKAACVQIYRLLAKRDLTNKVLNYAKMMGVMPSAVKINGAKTRWGSCSSKKSINFSWRLIMSEDDVIDYVVVHELAHLIEMNHSAKFWAIVENILPNHRERESKLKLLQKRLSMEDWE